MRYQRDQHANRSVRNLRVSLQRYPVTDTGLTHALVLTQVHYRLLRTGLAQLSNPAPTRYASPATTTRSRSTASPNNPACHHKTLTQKSGFAGPSL
jgi:hypothetical protein